METTNAPRHSPNGQGFSTCFFLLFGGWGMGHLASLLGCLVVVSLSSSSLTKGEDSRPPLTPHTPHIPCSARSFYRHKTHHTLVYAMHLGTYYCYYCRRNNAGRLLAPSSSSIHAAAAPSSSSSSSSSTTSSTLSKMRTTGGMTSWGEGPVLVAGSKYYV